MEILAKVSWNMGSQVKKSNITNRTVKFEKKHAWQKLMTTKGHERKKRGVAFKGCWLGGTQKASDPHKCESHLRIDKP